MKKGHYYESVQNIAAIIIIVLGIILVVATVKNPINQREADVKADFDKFNERASLNQFLSLKTEYEGQEVTMADLLAIYYTLNPVGSIIDEPNDPMFSKDAEGILWKHFNEYYNTAVSKRMFIGSVTYVSRGNQWSFKPGKNKQISYRYIGIDITRAGSKGNANAFVSKGLKIYVDTKNPYLDVELLEKATIRKVVVSDILTLNGEQVKIILYRRK